MSTSTHLYYTSTRAHTSIEHAHTHTVTLTQTHVHVFFQGGNGMARSRWRVPQKHGLWRCVPSLCSARREGGGRQGLRLSGFWTGVRVCKAGCFSKHFSNIDSI